MRGLIPSCLALLGAMGCLGLRSLSAGEPAKPLPPNRTLSATTWIIAGNNLGTGFLADAARRLVITNAHVVAGQEVVRVITSVRNP